MALGGYPPASMEPQRLSPRAVGNWTARAPGAHPPPAQRALHFIFRLSDRFRLATHMEMKHWLDATRHSCQ